MGMFWHDEYQKARAAAAGSGSELAELKQYLRNMQDKHAVCSLVQFVCA